MIRLNLAPYKLNLTWNKTLTLCKQSIWPYSHLANTKITIFRLTKTNYADWKLIIADDRQIQRDSKPSLPNGQSLISTWGWLPKLKNSVTNNTSKASPWSNSRRLETANTSKPIGATDVAKLGQIGKMTRRDFFE